MKRIIFCLLALSLLTVSCIKNPLAYPRVPAEILAFEVEGQKSVTIDPVARRVDIVLEETAEQDSVTVITYQFNEMAKPDVELPEVLDLTDSIIINYTTYPDQT